MTAISPTVILSSLGGTRHGQLLYQVELGPCTGPLALVGRASCLSCSSINLHAPLPSVCMVPLDGNGMHNHSAKEGSLQRLETASLHASVKYSKLLCIVVKSLESRIKYLTQNDGRRHRQESTRNRSLRQTRPDDSSKGSW